MNIKKYGGYSVIVLTVLLALLTIVVQIFTNYATQTPFSVGAWIGLSCIAVSITIVTIWQVNQQRKTEHAMTLMQQEAVFQSSLVTLLLFNPKGNLQQHASAILQKRLREQLDALDLKGRTHIFGILAKSDLITNEIGHQLQGIELQGADLQQTSLPNVDLEGSILREVNLQGANLSKVILKNASLENVNLSQAILTEADLQWTKLSGCLLNNADLSRAVLRGASLQKADLSQTVLTGADLQWTNLSECILNEADLSGVLLRQATFRQSNLSGANLTKADLSGEEKLVEGSSPKEVFGAPAPYHRHTFRTDLTGAKLSRAILRLADLRYCDLRDADLTDADLTDADLSQALLDDADMRGAMITKEQIRMAKSAENIRWG